MNQSLRRIRLGNYVIGGRIQTSNHKISGQFMLGHVADTMGIMNSFKDTTDQVLFMDYDSNKLEEIEDEVRDIQNHYDMGDIFIFESSPNHYFAIGLDLYTPDTISYILNHSMLVDRKFVYIYNKYGDNTLRILPKVTEKSDERPIRFIKVIEGDNMNGTKHLGLFFALAKLYPILHSYFDSRNHWHISTTEDCKYKMYETVNW